MTDTQQFTDEFKREVVQRANSGVISVSDLARELNISSSTIYRWRRTLTIEEAPPPAPKPAAEEAPKAKKKDGKKMKDKKEKKDKKGKKDSKGKKDKKKKGKKKK